MTGAAAQERTPETFVARGYTHLMRLLASMLFPLCVMVTGAHAHNVIARPWSVADLPVVRRLQVPSAIPPLAAGTQSLRFENFFRRPVGPHGLEPTEELLAMDGRRVRMFGYMVLHDSPPPGRFLLSPLPVTLAEAADGQADDLPPAVLQVHLPSAMTARPAPYVPGVLMVEGWLEVGLRDEPDGRRSFVRLRLDWPADPAAGSGGER